MVDFVVKIPSGRSPIILQLSDPQIIDSSKAAEGRLSAEESSYWTPDKKEARCYKYIREVVEATRPDLILIAGDIVYGEFDHDGEALLGFVEFMEELGIPWAPVLGNHESESRMGVDWQCEQFASAEHCLFRQRSLTGNGNYTAGIEQGGRLTRVFYMLDSNSGKPSERSLVNGHSKHPAGFGEDQIAWYTEDIGVLRMAYPDVGISFTFHIALASFEDAYAKYGYVSERGASVFPLIIDGRDESDRDIGMLLSPIHLWDGDRRVWNGLKALGVDSIFVGHDHEACAGVVYEGIRCQFGLKSSTYDSNTYLNEASIPVKGFTPAGTPLVGGTVISLTPDDGRIERVYHYYCRNVDFEMRGLGL